VLGPTGVGKSFLRIGAEGMPRWLLGAFYTRSAALFPDLAIARADGSLRSLLLRLSRIDVLVIDDDWAMAPLAETESRDFWEICEDRYQTRSTIVTSQLPVTRWHEQIGDPPPLTVSLTGWFTMRIESICAAIRCGRITGSRTHSMPQLRGVVTDYAALPIQLGRSGPEA
jgi:DNA replication protein DnaC